MNQFWSLNFIWNYLPQDQITLLNSNELINFPRLSKEISTFSSWTPSSKPLFLSHCHALQDITLFTSFLRLHSLISCSAKNVYYLSIREHAASPPSRLRQSILLHVIIFNKISSIISLKLKGRFFVFLTNFCRHYSFAVAVCMTTDTWAEHHVFAQIRVEHIILISLDALAFFLPPRIVVRQ